MGVFIFKFLCILIVEGSCLFEDNGIILSNSYDLSGIESPLCKELLLVFRCQSGGSSLVHGTVNQQNPKSLPFS
jgi:hypothetical protein